MSIQFFEMFRNYKPGYLKKDISAGLSVAAISLPQVMGYALIAGLNPVYGLYTFIVSTIIALFFGTSNFMVVGPTNQIAVVIASGLGTLEFVHQGNYVQYVFLLTFLVGVIQIILGSLKLGDLVNYVSHAVIIGLTSGVALIIASGQLDKIFGITVEQGNVLKTVYEVGANIYNVNLFAVIMSIITMLIIVLCKKFIPGLPSYLIAVLISVVLVYVLGWGQHLELVGNFDSSLPRFNLIKFDIQRFQDLFGLALSIAILGFTQVLSIVKALEEKAGQKAQLNKEFIGQGMINIICSFFSSFAITGSFTKTFANYEAGAESRFSEFFAGMSVLIFILIFSRIVSLIPIASLATIVVLIAYYMFDFQEIIQTFKTTRFDALVFSVTFVTTILTPRLDYAIYFGVLVSFILVLKNTSSINYSHLSYQEDGNVDFEKEELDKVKEDDFICINLSGTLHFHTAENLKERFNESFRKDKVFVLRMREIEEIDLTTIQEIDKFIDRVQQHGGEVILSGVGDNIKLSLKKYGVLNKIDEDNIFMGESGIFNSTKEAVKEAEKVANGKKDHDND